MNRNVSLSLPGLAAARGRALAWLAAALLAVAVVGCGDRQPGPGDYPPLDPTPTVQNQSMNNNDLILDDEDTVPVNPGAAVPTPANGSGAMVPDATPSGTGLPAATGLGTASDSQLENVRRVWSESTRQTMQQMSGAVQQLRTQAAATGTQLSEASRERLDDLDARTQGLQARFQELQNAGAETWADGREEIEEGLRELRDAYNETLREIQSDQADNGA